MAEIALNRLSDTEYRRRIRAWTMYDWANSAFATTIMAAILPYYYSQVAGSTLPSAARATAYWNTVLIISLVIIGLLSPILGTISDINRGKKRFLAIFSGIGIIGTAMLVLVGTGDWILASILAIIGRLGFNGANVFYDAMLPHVAKEEDVDRVSARGYAMGYLGGGLLLAINVVMLQVFPGTLGARLSFLSVAVWWAVFSIPIFTQVPEPRTDVGRLAPGESVVSASFARIWQTLKDIRQYRELFKYLIAFLIYIDGVGTIINVAVIYGAELGFGSTELVLALLLVQFVAIPYSLIFGRLPSREEKRRPFFLAFVVFNLIALPLVGVLGVRLLPAQTTGARQPDYADTATAHGQGEYLADSSAISYDGSWQANTIPAETLGEDKDAVYLTASAPGAGYTFTFNGQKVSLTYSTGPDRGIWAVELDGQPLLDADTGEPVTINGYSRTVRYGVSDTFLADVPGEHTLSLNDSGQKDPASSGSVISLAAVEVLPPIRQSKLIQVIGLIALVEVLCLALAWLLGKAVFTKLAETLDTRRSILLSLAVYSVIAIWGYFLDSVIEFWFLAWLVAIVQGGVQALSRSLFAYLSPASKSGEFFGLFGIMEKFSTLLGPIVMIIAVAAYGSSRPGVLSLIFFFIIGGYLMMRVNVAEGRRVALAEDAEAVV